MSTRTEREKNKRQHDKHMSILMELLREDQNKYCADCRSKGPRWASWNLGIFVCITCAGIHRNLGVHISRVKSVNLDAWTPEQIKNMQEWGNKRAAEYYEYHLPDGFRRPQSDSYHSFNGNTAALGLEGFIRNKYEKKLYISKDGPPPAREVKSSPEKTSKEKKKSTDINIKKPRQSNSSDSKPAKNNTATKDTMISRPATTAKVESATADLLSLSEPTATQNNTLLSMASVRQPQDNTADLLNFGGSSFQSATNNPAPPASTQTFGFDLSQPTSSVPVASANQLSANPGVPSSGQSNLEEDLFKEDFSSSGGQSTKDTIMALYQPSQKQASPQMFGVPGGVYLQQQQQQPQGGVSLNRPNTMAPQYNPQYNAQQQQMYQVNQVQQQMAKLGFAQAQTNQAMPNNRAVPNSQVMPGYNFNQTVTGMPPYNNAPAPYGNTPLMNGGTPMMNGGWMAQRPGNFPQQQAMPQYLTTGPTAPGFNMYQGRGGMPAGQTLSNNLWK